MIPFLGCLVVTYLIGSIPTGYWLTWLVKREDIRDLGSGNVGATNVFRSVGKSLGIVVLAIDILKGFLPVMLFPRFFPSAILAADVHLYQLAIGIAAICGHNWTIFLNFKGGKGVATTCGVVAAIFPKALLGCVLVWVLVAVLTRYVSLSSILAAFSFLAWFVLFYRSIPHFREFVALSLVLIVVILFKHRSNVKRLLEGTEYRFGQQPNSNKPKE